MQINLAKFGYKLNMKVKFLIFKKNLANAWTMYGNMENGFKFCLNNGYWESKKTH